MNARTDIVDLFEGEASTCYASQDRRVARFKVGDIDSKRLLIHIDHSKTVPSATEIFDFEVSNPT